MTSIQHSLATLVLALCLVTAATSPGAAATTDADTSTSIVEYSVGGTLQPSYVVTLDANASDAATALQDWANASSQRRIVRLDNQSHTATVAAPAAMLTPSFIEQQVTVFQDNELATRSYVTAVRPNIQVSLIDPVTVANESRLSPRTIGVTGLNDPRYPLQGVATSDDITQTSMGTARSILDVDDLSGNASGFTAAVVDTGVNYAGGSIFGDRILNASKNFLTGATVNESGMDAIADGNGHGTWTAAAIAGNASGTRQDGMAPNASLLVLKALDDQGQGSAGQIAAAIRYAAAHDADVISLSLGSVQYSQPIADAVRDATRQGSVVIAAAGNSRWTRSPGIATPADVPGVLTVGASNASRAPDAWSAAFSQAGPDPSTTDGAGLESQGASIDVVAPGTAITARVPTASGGLENQTLSGTSMSTPLVAGGVLRAMAANATLADATPRTVVAAVQDAAVPAPHLAVAEAGHGMFNAANLAAGTHPGKTQAEVMTSAARQRNQWYQAASDAAGGWLAAVRMEASDAVET